MFTLKRGSKTVGLFIKDRPYVIGFKSLVHIRAVHYNIHPNPNFTLVKTDPIENENITAYMNSTLFIPKCQGSVLDPLNDGGFHLSKYKAHEFYMLPHKGVGIITPYKLMDEDRYEFVFKAHAFIAHSPEA